MKTSAVTFIGIAGAVLIAACALFEDRLGRVMTPDFASAALDAGCKGGREFIEAATASFDPATTSLLIKGVEAACAFRADRTMISATVYDNPLDDFCATTKPLTAAQADAPTLAAFNTRHTHLCEARP